jgi:hypothetical protein
MSKVGGYPSLLLHNDMSEIDGEKIRDALDDPMTASEDNQINAYINLEEALDLIATTHDKYLDADACMQRKFILSICFYSSKNRVPKNIKNRDIKSLEKSKEFVDAMGDYRMVQDKKKYAIEKMKCCCSMDRLKTMYYAVNIKNGNVLPLGSTCVDKIADSFVVPDDVDIESHSSSSESNSDDEADMDENDDTENDADADESDNDEADTNESDSDVEVVGSPVNLKRKRIYADKEDEPVLSQRRRLTKKVERTQASILNEIKTHEFERRRLLHLIKIEDAAVENLLEELSDLVE